MNRYRSGKFLAVLTVLVLALTAIPVSLAQGPNATDKIEGLLLEKFSTEGTADFIVHFAEQADLSPAYQMSWQERGEFVVNALTAAAQRSQGRAKALLDARGLRYRTFIAGNELYVWAGDLAAAQALAALPEVSFVRATRVYYIDPIEPVPEPETSPQAFAWGILDTNADDFWAQFGVQGNGIVVSNIDTGVQWNHPALDQAYKCPGNPGDSACWSDPTGTCGSTPCDNHGHGTHTMGTMVGDDDPSLPYQVGMAPNALWIACKGCGTQYCEEAHLNACADWILQPGGNPANRPHVVNNSWGGNYGTCNTWYLAKVQAWRAAGIFPAFSAGNNYNCNQLGVPAVYQDSFASAAHDSSRNIADFSSKGPAPNSPPTCHPYQPYTKPNISAPGVGVMSSVPTNSWASYSGTSMASPHTAGAVALLWSCNPTLIGQIDATFQLLQDNADTPPAGTCGAPPAPYRGNYTYGYGYLNVYQAGIQACSGVQTGWLDGYVRDAATNNPIAGATVTAVPGLNGNTIEATTDPNGYYTMTLPVGTYDVTASKNGYTSQTVQDIQIFENQVTHQNFALTFIGQWTQATQPTCFDLTRIDAEYYPATGKVYILGGRSGNNTVGTIYEFDPVANTCSATGATMPVPISNYTINLVNNGTYDLLCTFGGRDSAGGQTLAVQCYNPILNTATQVATLPSAYTGYIPGAQVVYNNRVYIFGGFNPNSSPYELTRTDRFNPINNTFTQLGNLSMGRGYIMAAVVDGKIYAFGGTVFDGTSLIAQTRTEVMADPEGAGTWDNAAVAELPSAGAEGRAFGFDSNSPYSLVAGKVILAPAYAQWPNDSGAVIAYNVATNSYDEAFPDLITARRDNAGVFVPICTPDPTDGLPAMWVIGGHMGSDNPPYAPPEYYPLQCQVAAPPEASFTSNSPVCLGQTMRFTDTSQATPPVSEWFWDFGDGETSTETNPVHTYTSAGNFVVTLVVTNSAGSDSVTDTVTVHPLPLASFDYSPASGPLPLTVYFTNTSQYAQNPTWDFGDGSPPATGDHVNHTYTVSGTYTVTLTVASPYGCGTATATAQVYAYLQPGPPTAAFTFTPTQGCEPLEVRFTDQSTGFPPITSWLWDFGDGETSTETNPVHIYTSAGDFVVTLVVTNSAGSDSATDIVTVHPLPLASFDYSPASGPAPLTVYFTNTSQYAQNPTWDFGDGSPPATGNYVNHTYTVSGTYTVVLTVTSPYGCGDATATAQVQVFPTYYLVADFTADPAEGCVPLEVSFTDQSQGNPPIVSWLWDFGDGDTSTETNPVHTYTSAGTYEVVLTVDNISFTASTTRTVKVNPLPAASFDYSPVSGTAPLTVYFTNTSQYAQNPTWNFGDGGTGVGDVISHTYVVNGTFSVTLTVESPYGCGTASATHSVVVRPAERRYYIYLPLVFKGY